VSETLAGLPNAQLLARVRDLVQRGNTVEAGLLAHLAEVDARRPYLEEGCSSMFTYCQRVLLFAEGVAYKRIQAARAARKHPEILEAGRETHAQLEELRALMRHQIPDGDIGKILARAVALLHAQVRKRKFAETSRPRSARSSASSNETSSRHIPAAIRRAVSQRDGGRCS
jgi:hypothetical protein